MSKHFNENHQIRHTYDTQLYSETENEYTDDKSPIRRTPSEKVKGAGSTRALQYVGTPADQGLHGPQTGVYPYGQRYGRDLPGLRAVEWRLQPAPGYDDQSLQRNGRQRVDGNKPGQGSPEGV